VFSWSQSDILEASIQKHKTLSLSELAVSKILPLHCSVMSSHTRAGVGDEMQSSGQSSATDSSSPPAAAAASFCSLPYDMSTASSKASSPQSAI
jgi:hypothetical protein